MLISQTTGPDTLLFSYDTKGKAVSVRHIHTEENNTLTTNDYYYLRNAQSDIVKIIDGTGITVVEYSYDSWDRQLSFPIIGIYTIRLSG